MVHKQLEIEGIIIDIEKKKIKNIRLVVYPPTANTASKVCVSAPIATSQDNIKAFLISKIDWIKKHKERFAEKTIPAKQLFLEGEIHYFQGIACILRIIERNAPPQITHTTEIIENHTKNYLNLYVIPNTTTEQREALFNQWYRIELKRIINPLVEKWEGIIGVKSNECRIKKMKTRWGTCNIQAKRIWLSLELAKKSTNCLEYIIVHELVHLLERLHNARFVDFMNKFMPNWKNHKKELNES